MNPRQQTIMNILSNYVDEQNSVTISIHELGFPVTPNSINPAIREFSDLQDLGMIKSFERVSSRSFKIVINNQVEEDNG